MQNIYRRHCVMRNTLNLFRIHSSSRSSFRFGKNRWLFSEMLAGFLSPQPSFLIVCVQKRLCCRNDTIFTITVWLLQFQLKHTLTITNTFSAKSVQFFSSVLFLFLSVALPDLNIYIYIVQLHVHGKSQRFASLHFFCYVSVKLLCVTFIKFVCTTSSACIYQTWRAAYTLKWLFATLVYPAANFRGLLMGLPSLASTSTNTIPPCSYHRHCFCHHAIETKLPLPSSLSSLH